MDAVAAGLTQVCHLFDTFDGRLVDSGVSQPSLADIVLVEPRLQPEIILDGIHVPQELVRLAHLAATSERLIAITDALPGAGLPDGTYAMADGRPFSVRNDDVARLEDGSIVGSCLTMNRVARNMLERFGFTPLEVARMTAENPARAIGIDGQTGSLVPGKDADIVRLGTDFRVRQTWVKGVCAYEQ